MLPDKTPTASELSSRGSSSVDADIAAHEAAATEHAKRGAHGAALKEWEAALELANGVDEEEDDGATVWRICEWTPCYDQ